MSTGKQRKALPAERGCAWLLTFLLTVLVAITLLVFTAMQMLTSAGLHLSVAADDGMLDRQILEISGNIDQMAAEYGFDAVKVRETISRDELKEFNRKTAEWWTRLLTEGESGPIPKWYAGSIEDVIYAEAEEKELTEEAQTIITDLTTMIGNTVVPVRETTLVFGTKMAKDMADIRGIIRSLKKLPLLGLVLCLACAGGIALLLGREPSRLLKHYGTGAAAAGITVLASVITLTASRPEAIITEASEGLAREFSTLMNRIGISTGLAAGFLLAAGYLCLFLYRRKTSGSKA